MFYSKVLRLIFSENFREKFKILSKLSSIIAPSVWLNVSRSYMWKFLYQNFKRVFLKTVFLQLACTITKKPFNRSVENLTMFFYTTTDSVQTIMKIGWLFSQFLMFLRRGSVSKFSPQNFWTSFLGKGSMEWNEILVVNVKSRKRCNCALIFYEILNKITSYLPPKFESVSLQHFYDTAFNIQGTAAKTEKPEKLWQVSEDI